jgi:hypothetical protein
VGDISTKTSETLHGRKALIDDKESLHEINEAGIPVESSGKEIQRGKRNYINLARTQ